jgi:hypothetical protein
VASNPKRTDEREKKKVKEAKDCISTERRR